MNFSEKTAVVTGGSRGLGRAICLELARGGANVMLCYAGNEAAANETVAACESLGAKAVAIRCDVSKEDEVKALMDAALKTFGRIDILVNNAGFGISGAVEFTSTEDAKSLFDVNFFGMVNMNRQVVPIMREAGHGRIVNLSSVAAPCPIPFQAYYSAGKAAVNAYTMALANELRPFGITVCAVQPGDIHTGFTAARVKTMEGDDAYGGRIGRSVQRMEHDEQNGMDPAKAGAFIARVAMKRRPKPIYTIRLDYQFFVFLTRILPGRTLNWLIGLLYAK